MISDGLNPIDGKEPHFFVAVFLIVLSLFLMTGFQSYVMLKERISTRDEFARQAPVIEQAKKMRAQLDSIAKRTAQLAEGGNIHARSIVEQLKKEGITINPNAPADK